MMVERGKMQNRIEDLQANNTVMDSELTVIKKEILKEKHLQEDIQWQKDQSDSKNDVLAARI